MDKLILQHFRMDGLILDHYESKIKKTYIDNQHYRTYYELTIKDRVIRIYDNGEIQNESGEKI